MKISTNNLIIFSLYSLHFLCISKSSTSNDSCYLESCTSGSPTIQFPFRIKNLQPKSCGSPGFDVYCNSIGDTFLQFPSGPTFLVRNINYSTREIKLSDRKNCLTQALISLDLNKTPFRLGDYSTYRLYNCSGDGFIRHKDRIECLSTSSDFSVLGAGDGGSVHDSNCMLMKTVYTPGSYNLTKLNALDNISLTWDWPCYSCGDAPPSPETYTSSSSDSSPAVFGLMGLGFGTSAIILVLVCCWYCRTNENNQVSLTHSTATVTTPGLDQITIDSYPMVVTGDSGCLIKPDDDCCPICLSDYSPAEVLKMLPECLHRFHADCIDQWLRAKATCSICRIYPTHNPVS